jgi:DNA-binding FadR family transcriptional regulator
MSRLHAQLMQVLLSDIATGQAREGELLPPETELAAQFGVSRGVVRETLRGLEERGVITVRHGRGATVCPARSWDVLDVVVLSAVLPTQAGARLLRELFECRQLLEVHAAGLAAEHARGEDLANLADAFARMAATADRARLNPALEDLFHEADVTFHSAIFDAAGNRVLFRVVEPIQRALLMARRPLAARLDGRPHRNLPEHKRILVAIADRDPEAAREAMEAHLTTVEKYVRDYEQRLAEVAEEEEKEESLR